MLPGRTTYPLTGDGTINGHLMKPPVASFVPADGGCALFSHSRKPFPGFHPQRVRPTPGVGANNGHTSLDRAER